MYVKVSKKGQIVIPKEIREKLGIKEGSNLKIKLEGKSIILEPFSEHQKRYSSRQEMI